MIVVKPSKELKQQARARAKEMGGIRNSITKGKGNFAGFLAEEIIYTLTPHSELVFSYDYDVTIRDATFDVKTKRTTVTPLPFYECSIARTSLHQKCDGYIFCRYNKDTDEMFICGVMGREEYFERSRYLRKGQVVDNNHFKVKADCYNLPISDLYHPKYLRFNDKLEWKSC